ncbi:hypothetical protein T4B_11155 [Trichinella pseudospiralis]|uniref:Uncharacterized protein n=1 Tax=Trichinella pseudospiralis TaxID=6337 RepID=A0A0V1J7T4_TRIPS|nr:hypothetical protein T4A_1448 [Trichinella pseudospiralis]KRZ24560.1 hypothetical protein T4B_11155 [Trichinella pseudospiralis]KRZ31047.1 hypothetical protein T4C_10661 [Trichinella pseudospiralis]
MTPFSTKEKYISVVGGNLLGENKFSSTFNIYHFPQICCFAKQNKKALKRKRVQKEIVGKVELCTNQSSNWLQIHAHCQAKDVEYLFAEKSIVDVQCLKMRFKENCSTGNFEFQRSVNGTSKRSYFEINIHTGNSNGDGELFRPISISVYPMKYDE